MTAVPDSDSKGDSEGEGEVIKRAVSSASKASDKSGREFFGCVMTNGV